jgi:hypothetical protein
MRRDDGGDARLVGRFSDELAGGLGRIRVELRRRLIGQEQFGPADQRPAMATRCFWPPLRRRGRLSAWDSMPSSSRFSKIRPRSSG